MMLAKQISTAAIALACFWATGCCGPLRCGTSGCDTGGPLALNNCNGCGDCAGCGELYIDPWINEPANRCDPCDQCGNYNGQSCGKCRSVIGGLRSLWGYRCDDGCSGGCDSCSSGCDSCAIGGSYTSTCDSCGTGSCGCGAEVGCGLEATCGCEGACSCEPACGVEPGCGFEPGCGLEPGCSCSSCSGHGIVTEAPAVIHDHNHHVSQSKYTKPYTPQRTRQIFQSREH